LVTTAVPPIIVVFSAPDPEAGADEPAAAGVDAGLDPAAAAAGLAGELLLHPAASSATAASPAIPAYLPNIEAPFSQVIRLLP
jgi:hypothetical protein